MKLLFTLLITLLLYSNLFSQVTRRSLLEYATGTWCAGCACSHEQVNNHITPDFPNTVFIAYHSGGADPFSVFQGDDIVPLIGFGGLPGGVVDRVTGIMGVTHWYNAVDDMDNAPAGVDITILPSFNADTRLLELNITITAQMDLNPDQRLQLVLTEDNLIASQAGTVDCPGGDEFVHHNVARMVLNGLTGEVLNNGNAISNGQVINYSQSFTLDEGLVYENCKIVGFVYGYTQPLSKAYLQQAEEVKLISEPVPVEFGTFSSSVNGNNIVLNWNTITELNNAGFILSRSVNKENYETIAFIDGNGTTSESVSYTFEDVVYDYSGVVTYKLEQEDFDGTVTLITEHDVVVNIPAEYIVTQNYPNPFNPETSINFSLPEASKVLVVVYDILGNRMITLADGLYEAGTHKVNFNAESYTSGVYFYSITTEAGTIQRKMLLLK